MTMGPRFFSIAMIFRPSLTRGFGFFPVVMSNEVKRRVSALRAKWRRKLVIGVTTCAR